MDKGEYFKITNRFGVRWVSTTPTSILLSNWFWLGRSKFELELFSFNRNQIQLGANLKDGFDEEQQVLYLTEGFMNF